MQRINYSKVAPEGIRALGGLETYLRSSGLEPALLNLIKTRASQLNGCAYCIDMHTKDARARGETEQRLYALAWRETPFYTDRERAALAWTEAVTLISRWTCPGRALRGGPTALLGEGTRGSDPGAGRDQRLEPAEHRVPHRAGDVPAEGPGAGGHRVAEGSDGIIRLKRAYEPAAKGDGRRVLVERLWPRGVPKPGSASTSGQRTWRRARPCDAGSATTPSGGPSSGDVTWLSCVAIPRLGRHSSLRPVAGE